MFITTGLSHGDPTLSAWVDESVIVDGSRCPTGTYTLAAVVAKAAAVGTTRDVVRALTLTRGGRLHWVDESGKRRDRIAAAIAALELSVIVVAGSPVQRAKQERARRCCLERLLQELSSTGVREVCLESRTATPDRRDLSLVESARRKGLIPRGFRVGFARPRDEPMLWIPDAVAGAVTASRLGEPRWQLAMSEILTEHEVEVR
ncbi:hypothetical protein [Kribbella solani]|uniref:Uncharacterized protein n=1 Tax=Kribbella solani TaxID=236067 RepID=A0A841DUK9_9ACTN|nr:hypothetical protein [Kribbella solani]MBB5982292.1 hypothetical protein [Kribbella solani]MDX2968476.1 hypothetical protein [Kribbella solani]MDX3003835.1 hypothetical protein [Kribbella solani]